MKITLSLALLLLVFFEATAHDEKAKTSPAYQVTYSVYRNGKEVPGTNITLKYAGEVAYLSGADDKIRNFIDYGQKQTVTILNYKNELFKTSVPFDSLPKPRKENKAETILGYKCDYAVLSSFSNTIEIWYSAKTGAKGSPYPSYLPDDNSLVLKVLINGNRLLVVNAIDVLAKDSVPDYPSNQAKEVIASELEELKIKSRFTSVKIFENEVVNFDNSLVPDPAEKLEANRTYRFSKGSVILKKVALPQSWKKGGQVFAKLTSWSNGDAYDRTGSVFILPVSGEKATILDALQNGLARLPVFTDNNGAEYQGFVSTATYDVPVEIMRFFTSFGVRHFNNLRAIHNYPWKEEAVYNQEVTSLIPKNENEVWVGVFIGNYDQGGHKVSLELNFHPSFMENEDESLWVQPLFYTVNVMEMSGQNYGRLFRNDTLAVFFEVPENVENLKLLYTTTGHGGWGGGDEFNPKLNQILIDGKLVYQVVPWRTDCATYRMYNPASGNFENGLSSSDLSRSNWCPATLTPPDHIFLDSIQPGKHLLELIIDQGADEGNSFSHWSVSGILTGSYKLQE